MEKIKATIDGRMMETEAGTTILELLETGSIRYEDNPVSAAYAEYPELATIGIILTLIIVPITLGLRKLLEKVGPSDE